MMGDKMQDNAAMNGVSHFPTTFAFLLCEIAYSISDLCEVMSYHAKNLCLLT